MSLYFLFAGFGSACSCFCALSVSINNFSPNLRGFAIGVPMSFFGLSAFIYSRFNRWFFVKDGAMNVEGFLLFLAITTGVINLLASFVVLEEKNDGYEQIDAINGSIDSIGTEEEEEEVAHAEPQDDSPIQDEEYAARLGVKSPETWLLFYAFFAAAGTGLMFINSCGAMILSLIPGGKPNDENVQRTQAFHVGMFSLLNWFGRVSTGLMADYASSRFRVPRVAWMIFAVGCIIIAESFAVSVTNVDYFVWVTIFMGCGYGAMYTTLPSVITEVSKM